MKTDPYSALDKPQKHTLRGRTSGRSFTLSAPPPGGRLKINRCCRQEASAYLANKTCSVVKLKK